VSENEVIRKLFGPQKDEVTGGLRKLHFEELHNLYSSPDVITVIEKRNIRWAGHVSPMERLNMHTEFVAKPEGKRPLGRRRRGWEDNIKVVKVEVKVNVKLSLCFN
jgi:hypothetical protein